MVHPLSICTGFYKQYRNERAGCSSEAQKLVSLKIWNALLVAAYNRICLCQSDSVSIENKWGALNFWNSYGVNKLNRKQFTAVGSKCNNSQ